VQSIVFDTPYVFVPPYPGVLWPAFLQQLLPRHLRRSYQITQVECHGLEHLRQSKQAGHGILLAPNHCRPVDPFVVGEVARQAGLLPYTLASWHLFMQSHLQSWMLRRAGVFSIYREGMDRAAINASVDILSEGKRPLVLFPEGVVSRTNDQLSPLMEGTSLIARTAAKKRASATPPGQVVVHPIALRYTFSGELPTAIGPTLDELEHRLSWLPQKELPLLQRIYKLGRALLGLKEMEYLGSYQTGDIGERLLRLINHLLEPLEKEWVPGKPERSVVLRVKKLRMAILPDMVQGDISDAERERRWRQLADMYLAQQLSCYPPDYIALNPTVDRMLETVERFEEDLTDVARPYGPMKATVHVGEAIPVSPTRERGAAEDPLMLAVETSLKTMLGIGQTPLATPDTATANTPGRN
jgi:1-acyl-sn-glycerol-3-phosphate acyltransferase